MKASFLSAAVGFSTIMGMAITAADAAPIVVDFGQGGGPTYQTGAVLNGTGSTITYNRIAVGLAGTFSSATPTTPVLKDISGADTVYTMEKSGGGIPPGTTGSNNTGLGGPLTAGANALFPDAIGQTFGFLDSTGGLSQSGPITYTFGNLNLSATYTFDILSARAAGGPRPTLFTVTGATVGTGSVDSAGNTGTLVNIAGIAPALDGTITLSYNRDGTASAYSYLNGAQITEVIPEPASIGLLGMAGMTLLGRRRK